MSIKIITQKEGIERRISDTYTVMNFITAADSDKFSLAMSTANQHNKTTLSTSERAYYILEWELIIDGQRAKEGDVVFISANTKYNFKGNFKAILINSPPFKIENETTIQI